MIWGIMHGSWRWPILVMIDVAIPMMLRMLDMIPGISVRIVVETGELGPGEPVHSFLAHNLPDEDTVMC